MHVCEESHSGVVPEHHAQCWRDHLASDLDYARYFGVRGGAAGGPTSTSWNFGIGLVVLEICFSPLELNRGSLAATEVRTGGG